MVTTTIYVCIVKEGALLMFVIAIVLSCALRLLLAVSKFFSLVFRSCATQSKYVLSEKSPFSWTSMRFSFDLGFLPLGHRSFFPFLFVF